MRIAQARFVVLASLSLLPGVAYAQRIPTWLAVAALSPLAVILLAIVLGFATRSWRVGAAHTGLAIAWVVLFIFAARYVENDYVIWTPLLIYAAHALLILVLVVVNIAKRIRAGGRAY